MGSLSEVSEESDASDFLHVEALPAACRSWEAEQDAERRRIRQLAERLRPEPRLPCDPSNPAEAFRELSSGVALPFAHCAFGGCTQAQVKRDGDMM